MINLVKINYKYKMSGEDKILSKSSDSNNSSIGPSSKNKEKQNDEEIKNKEIEEKDNNIINIVSEIYEKIKKCPIKKENNVTKFNKIINNILALSIDQHVKSNDFYIPITKLICTITIFILMAKFIDSKLPDAIENFNVFEVLTKSIFILNLLIVTYSNTKILIIELEGYEKHLFGYYQFILQKSEMCKIYNDNSLLSNNSDKIINYDKFDDDNKIKLMKDIENQSTINSCYVIFNDRLNKIYTFEKKILVFSIGILVPIVYNTINEYEWWKILFIIFDCLSIMSYIIKTSNMTNNKFWRIVIKLFHYA